MLMPKATCTRVAGLGTTDTRFQIIAVVLLCFAVQKLLIRLGHLTFIECVEARACRNYGTMSGKDCIEMLYLSYSHCLYLHNKMDTHR